MAYAKKMKKKKRRKKKKQKKDQVKYKVHNINNFRRMPQMENIPEQKKFEMEVVGNVLPFKCNNYVAEELIDWDNYEDDPMFKLTFPQRDMLKPKHFNKMADLIKNDASRNEIKETANEIRWQLNPQPAGQWLNAPKIDGVKLTGIQHKYQETALFFPSQGQTCHAYCSFCFRWPQFVGLNDVKFAMKESELLIKYLKQNPQISDVLFTGGDPMIMKARIFGDYVNELLKANISTLDTIRIGTKSLSYWPYKFTQDGDADDMLRIFEKTVKAGKHLAIMAHFNHPRELETKAVQEAIRRIRNTGAEIRTQSPILNHINADADIWADMWRKQVRMGIIPYYMFIVRDTGAQHYFELPLMKTWKLYQKAYKQVSGLGRTVRGPSMSADPGKVCVLGPTSVKGEKVMALTMLQGRNPDWVYRPFFAKYDESAMWLDDLVPAFEQEKFFFEDELAAMYERDTAAASHIDVD